jgi:hypothetical protein
MSGAVDVRTGVMDSAEIMAAYNAVMVRIQWVEKRIAAESITKNARLALTLEKLALAGAADVLNSWLGGAA